MCIVVLLRTTNIVYVILWCQAVELATSSNTDNCLESNVQDSNTADNACYFENYVKGKTAASGFSDTIFRADVHVAFQDYDIDINKIPLKTTAERNALTHEYPYKIFCVAEDDWKIEADAATNSLAYSAPSLPNLTPLSAAESFKDAIGIQTTLDETPPSFTELYMEDPTAANDAIVVTFQLNEAGTAYCRATRTDSGETAGDMPINRILTADWSAAVSAGSTTATIEISQLENVVPELTLRDDDVSPIAEATQYDVYCWAKDSAEDSFGNARQNYMTQDYVGTATADPAAPEGGHHANVWVRDTTPPVVAFVRGEAVVSESALQLTLQLSEPGTIWCQAAELTGGATGNCAENEIQYTGTGAACYFETYIKGIAAHNTVFRADVHVANVDVDIEVNKIEQQDNAASNNLVAETGYKIFCFAEDDWSIQADAATNSVSFSASGSPNFSPQAAVEALTAAIGAMTTLDLTPPAITIAALTGTETQITVTLQLNEAGTAWCRAVRTGFAAPSVLEILDTNFVSADLDAASDDTVVVTAYDADGEPLKLGTDYDVYCYAEDDLCAGCKVTNPVSTANVVATKTLFRTLDTTPPKLRLVDAWSISSTQIQIKLQVV